ncbi:retrovirus-related pol polyprotein from transposon TNT 1-94 [Tanacetum coccineum]|uniref:Retrovirus-related pol polyprotein from transposon TNT 1-94 n=1 Tax=Tanacetum coccineum TaxID=301880 RepID=A0ABQ5FKC2_9ASTR
MDWPIFVEMGRDILWVNRHETSTARTPEQNGVVERQNRTLVEAARTMLSAAKVPLDGENLDKMKEKDNVRIMQKSQENSQKQDNHEHGNGGNKEPICVGECYQSRLINGLKAVRNQGWRLDEGGASCDARSPLGMIGDECDKGRMPTKIELTLEQSQQGVSNDVLVSIEGVEE